MGMTIDLGERQRIQIERNRDIALEHAVNLVKAGMVDPGSLLIWADALAEYLTKGAHYSQSVNDDVYSGSAV